MNRVLPLVLAAALAASAVQAFQATPASGGTSPSQSLGGVVSTSTTTALKYGYNDLNVDEYYDDYGYGECPHGVVVGDGCWTGW